MSTNETPSAHPQGSGDKNNPFLTIKFKAKSTWSHRKLYLFDIKSSQSVIHKGCELPSQITFSLLGRSFQITFSVPGESCQKTSFVFGEWCQISSFVLGESYDDKSEPTFIVDAYESDPRQDLFSTIGNPDQITTDCTVEITFEKTKDGVNIGPYFVWGSTVKENAEVSRLNYHSSEFINALQGGFW